MPTVNINVYLISFFYIYVLYFRFIFSKDTSEKKKTGGKDFYILVFPAHSSGNKNAVSWDGILDFSKSASLLP